MKRILITLTAALYTVFLFANSEPKWSNDSACFKFYLDKCVKGRKAPVYYEDIKIQLTGAYLKADSDYVVGLIGELQPLMPSKKMYTVAKGGNIALHFMNNPDTSHRQKLSKYNSFRNIQSSDLKIESIDQLYRATTALSYFGGPQLSSYSVNEKGIKEAETTMLFNPDCPQWMRNKVVLQFIVVQLVRIDPKSKGKDNKSQPSYYQNHLPTLLMEFSETDKYIIYHSYLKHPNIHFLLKHPQYFIKYAKAYWGNFYYVLSFCALFVLIGVYFLVLFGMGIFNKPTNTYGWFVLRGMLVLQSATLVYISYAFVENNISLSGLAWHIYFPVSFLSLTIVYLIEKVLIRKTLNVFIKLAIQLFTTLLPFVLCIGIVSFGYGIRNNYLFVTYLALYGFVFVSMRLIINYLQFKAQNTIMEKDLELAHMREIQHKAELQALHSRINPHFLYNSLTSIAGLAKTDAAKTEQMALALSDFCRYAINKQNETFVTVEEEAAIAQTYLEIEQTRFGDHLQYTIQIANGCQTEQIPRFILQPLLENAVKHGVSKITRKGNITLKIYKNNEGLFIAVADNGPAFPEMLTNGYGLQSIHDKLELLYKGKAKLNWEHLPEKKIVLFLPYI
jgi:two-component system, LytTR family, sensor kinase